MNIKLIIGVAVIVFVLLAFCVSYVKAPPNKAYIISGFRKKPKILIDSKYRFLREMMSCL